MLPDSVPFVTSSLRFSSYSTQYITSLKRLLSRTSHLYVDQATFHGGLSAGVPVP